MFRRRRRGAKRPARHHDAGDWPEDELEVDGRAEDLAEDPDEATDGPGRRA